MDGARRTCAVVISEEAVQNLLLHSRLLAQVSEAAVLLLVEEFGEKAKSLEEYPERNLWLSDLLVPAGKYRKLLMGKRYLLIYQVKGNAVCVDAVVDCRKDYSQLV